MEEQRRNNPWLGLESYKEGEVLYGRDDDIRDLTQSVLNDSDTLLYGKSGIGKSSILNAGIIPAARRHGYQPVLIRLSHKEQHTYLQQIKNAIGNATTIRQKLECKDESKESLYEFFHRHTFHGADGERVKLLVIFDQFEEIFTLQSEELKKKRFFTELADFLNDVMPSELQHEIVAQADVQEEINVLDNNDFGDLFNDLGLGDKNDTPEYVTDNEIHIVFTIREDFLSEFEYYSASIPSLKQNRYGLRPLNEEQAAQIILRPMPGLIDKSVAKLIIEKVTGRTDFDLDGVPEIEVDSAVLSLYLNRLYEAKVDNKITAELVEQKGGEIIADFYNDAISDISDSTIEYLEDMLLNGQGRRDNITVFDAVNDGGATEAELDILCNKKKILRQFNYAGDLRIEYVHDILCPVVKNHKEERFLLRQQEEILKAEKAKRETIEREAEAERKRLQEEAQRMRKRNRRRITIFGLSFSFLTLMLLLVWYLVYRPYSTYYANFTMVNGWPVGLGPELDSDDKKELLVHYRLTRRGRLPVMDFMGVSYYHPYYKVEILNCKGNPTTNKMFESPLVSLAETANEEDHASSSFAQMQLRTSQWIFVPDADGNISRQIAYDINGLILYAQQYYRTSETSDESRTHLLWMNYVDPEGKTLRVRDNGADRIRITVKDGFFERMQFFNEAGAPQQNSRMAYGYNYEFDPESGNILSIIPLSEYGDSIREMTLRFTAFDRYLRWVEANNSKAQYSAHHIIYTMSDRMDTLRYDDDGNQIYRSEHVKGKYFRLFAYDIYGNLTKNSVYECLVSGNMRLKRQLTCSYHPQNHSLRERIFFNADDALKFRHEVCEGNDSVTKITYFGGKDVASLVPINSVTEGYHQLLVQKHRLHVGTEIIRTYRTIDNATGRIFIQRQERKIYDADSVLVKNIITDSVGHRTLSLENEVENGIIVGQHVIGLTGSVIRCPMWDDNQLCYYRKKFVRNFSGDIVAAKAINEFGEESLITYGTHEIKISVVPGEEIQQDGKDYSIYGIGSYKFSASSVNLNNVADYLHITDTLGTYYQSGLRDGDIILSMSASEVKVARPVFQSRQSRSTQKYYEPHVFYPQSGNPGMEHYPVYFTDIEMRHLQDFVSSQKSD